jgi:hypothetical protein
MHPITESIWLYDEHAPAQHRRRRIVRLAELLEENPSIDAAALIQIITNDLGVVVPRAVTVVGAANRILTRRSLVDALPIVITVRQAKLDVVQKMETVVRETKHLGRVLTPKWFGQLRGIVNAWNPEEVFSLPTHTAFMGYYDDIVCYQSDYLQTLDEAFDRLSAYGSINQKLREIAGPSSGYVSTAFEMLVLRPFAARGCIVEYEPPLPGGDRGEALVNPGGQNVYVEARVKMDEERGSGGFNPRTMGVKLFRKLQEKYAAQYAGIDAPLIVFFSLGASVLHDIEVEALIVEVLEDSAAWSLTAVVFCDFYQPHKMWLWRNRRAKYRLTRAAVQMLYDMFPIRRFQTTGLVLEKRRRSAAQ